MQALIDLSQRLPRWGAPRLRRVCAWLCLGHLYACGQPVALPVGPGALPAHLWQVADVSEEAAHAHPQEMPPSRWASVVAPFCRMPEPAHEAFAQALQAERCAQTQGLWHAALWACRCPAHRVFVPREGCLAVPPVIATQSVCTSLDWWTVKTACLRDLQIGRSGWHLHFAGRSQRTKAMRAILAQGDAGALVGHTLSLPPLNTPWSMHLTDRLGPQATPYLGFTDGHAHVMPDQYTQAWVRPTTSDLAREDLARLAESCRKALRKQPLVPTDVAARLCARAQNALADVHAAHADAWPAATSVTWQTARVAGMPQNAHLGALTWSLCRSENAANAEPLAVWRVVLRDEVVLGRALQISLDETPSAAASRHADDMMDNEGERLHASWQLTLLCDGAGAVQAWHIVSPEAAEQTGVLMACHKMLQPRQVKRTKLVLDARAP